jgi:hypothetical protein
MGTLGQSDGAAGTSPEGTGLAAGGLGEQEGMGGPEAVAGPLRLGVPAATDSGPEALGGATESPPIGAALLAALAEAGALRAGLAPFPQADTNRLARRTAAAVARPAGIILPRCRTAVP